eukprot:2342841-Prorocentrum_lima.AAC.1
MRPTLTNRFTATSMAANQSMATPAAGVEGVTHKSCPRFATDQGCSLEEDASMHIPRIVQDH